MCIRDSSFNDCSTDFFNSPLSPFAGSFFCVWFSSTDTDSFLTGASETSCFTSTVCSASCTDVYKRQDLKHLNSNKLQEQIADLISRKESLNTQYVSFKQEIKELELIHQNLSKYLKQDAPEIQRSSHNQLPSL